MQCLLCCETQTFIGIGACGHQPFCYKCIYKLHVVTKDHSCPICKQHLDLLVITDREGATFNQIKKLKLLKSKTSPNILFDGEIPRNLFEKLTQYRCFVQKCEEGKGFPSIAFLKKHLKEKHNRYLCDICVENKRCVLEQHKLYSYKTLENHQSHGDFDEFGNLVFLHPYCNFCKQYFFDQQGLKKHLSKEHYHCNTCPDTYKFTFYKDYKSLEVHFKMTHYMCPEEDCIAKGFIVFRTNSDLLAHKYVEHEKNTTGEKKSKDMTAISGFYTEGTKQQESKIKFHDKEGVNFEDEFLSLKKMKHRGFYHVEEQEDGELDFRPFYKKNIEEEEIYQMAFDNTVKKNNKAGRKQQYREVSSKGKGEDDKEESGVLMLEDLHLIKTTTMHAIEYTDFDRKISDLFSQDQSQRFSELKQGFNKKKIGAAQFLDGFLKLFSGKRQGYNIWPQYIRTIQNQTTRQELDAAYLIKIKTLPKKHQSLINTSRKFSSFMIRFTEEIEKNIQERIVNGTLNIRNKIKIDKARIFQMIEILRHMRPVDMIKLKFAANFSILPETLQFIETKIYLEPLTKIQNEFHKISETEFLNLYLYVKFCRDVLVGKKIHLEKQFIKEEILEEFLDDRPELQHKYGKRKESMTLEEQAEFQEQVEKKKMEKLQLKTFTKKNVVIDKSDKYEFPDLIETKKEEDKKVFDPKANISNQQYKQTFVYETKKVATRLKNLNQYFPSIGEAAKESKNTTATQPIEKKADPPNVPAQKPWWEKVSGKVEEKVEEGKIVGEISRKKKKGREVIEIQGGFR